MRKYANLKQEELGRRVGLTVAQVKRLEENTRKTAIKVELLRQIVQATGVTNEIFAGILAKVASKYLGVRLEVLPSNALVT
ncbi:MAG: helix-turn-helix transcriptional regulator, partial [bacterium]|nr:helix-turn-helix transcriptional regulator [bacterium]